MRPEDLTTLSQISRAFWSNAERGDRASAETLTAVSLLGLEPERAIEKTTQALLEKAVRQGMGVNPDVMNHPFYRLSPEERLVLTALHLGHWSYRRLGVVLGFTEDQVERFLWATRMRLAEQAANRRAWLYPSGPKNSENSQCPDYDPHSPWTQKFLDEESQPRERLFLQNHLMVCETCRKALASTRDLYYLVDSMLPVARNEGENEALRRSVERLKDAWKRAERLQNPFPSPSRVLLQFVTKPRIAVPLLAIAAYLIFHFRIF